MDADNDTGMDNDVRDTVVSITSLPPDQGQRSAPPVGDGGTYASKVIALDQQGIPRGASTGFIEQEISITAADIKIDSTSPIPSIQFSERVHAQVDYNMRNSLIVRLLGRSIGFKALQSRILALWKPAGDIKLIDLDNGYYIIRFSVESDYVKVLKDGPWTIYGSYLTVQPWSRQFTTLEKYPSKVIVWVRLPGMPYRYYSKALFRHIATLIGEVFRVDYNTYERGRGKFARLAILVDLNKPLRSYLYIDGRLQKLEYEGLQDIFFHCDIYGHSKDSCTRLHGENPEQLSQEKEEAANMCISSIGQRLGSRFRVLASENLEAGRDTYTAGDVRDGTVVAGERTRTQQNSVEQNQIVSRVEGNVVARSATYLASNPDKKKNVSSKQLGLVEVVPTVVGTDSTVVNHMPVVSSGSHAASAHARIDSIGKQPNEGSGSYPIAMDESNNDSLPSDDEEIWEEDDLAPMADVGVVVDKGGMTSEGAGSHPFRRQFRSFMREYKPHVVAIMEPRINGRVVDRVIGRLGFSNSFRVETNGFRWAHGEGSIDGGLCEPLVSDSETSMESSSSFTAGVGGFVGTWGDFNSILVGDERIGGSDHTSKGSRAFREFIQDVTLVDLGYWGPTFTWSRGNLHQRLDRCLVNNCWMQGYENGFVKHLDRLGSDHRPILLCFSGNFNNDRNRPFRFISAWQEHDRFVEFLQSNWNGSSPLSANLERFRTQLVLWNSEVFGHIGQRKRCIRARLRGIEKAL
ncbi:hypothetical protein GQ457_15G000410 [Hibiscus cannabinus]